MIYVDFAALVLAILMAVIVGGCVVEIVKGWMRD